jgi:hypothetical protein
MFFCIDHIFRGLIGGLDGGKGQGNNEIKATARF